MLDEWKSHLEISSFLVLQKFSLGNIFFFEH